jgi:hypothetical protein
MDSHQLLPVYNSCTRKDNGAGCDPEIEWHSIGMTWENCMSGEITPTAIRTTDSGALSTGWGMKIGSGRRDS